MTTQQPAIHTNRLTKRYGARRGIENIDLDVERGEIFGFLGPNGAGKSTTLRTMLGFMYPTSGSAQILGLDAHIQTRAVHERIGNLPSEFALDDRLTGQTFIALIGKLRGLDDLSYAHEIAERIDADLNHPMRRLSRGQKQKIGIIQALMHQPDLVVLDEPTGGLDPLAQERFLDLLAEARERGQTVFFSSHILSEVERVADRVAIIRDGHMVEVARTSDLTGRALRHVTITFSGPPNADTVEQLRHVAGIHDLAVDGATVTLTAQGDPNGLVHALATKDLASLEIVRPSLEELFLSFYGESNHGAPHLAPEGVAA
ncbi:MAG: ABC transporter ATP-binding protein [Thermomicrobiales bacterium]